MVHCKRSYERAQLLCVPRGKPASGMQPAAGQQLQQQDECLPGDETVTVCLPSAPPSDVTARNEDPHSSSTRRHPATRGTTERGAKAGLRIFVGTVLQLQTLMSAHRLMLITNESKQFSVVAI